MREGGGYLHNLKVRELPVVELAPEALRRSVLVPECVLAVDLGEAGFGAKLEASRAHLDDRDMRQGMLRRVDSFVMALEPALLLAVVTGHPDGGLPRVASLRRGAYWAEPDNGAELDPHWGAQWSESREPPGDDLFDKVRADRCDRGGRVRRGLGVAAGGEANLRAGLAAVEPAS